MDVPVTLEELIETVHRQSPSESELDRLGTAVAMSQEMGALLDDLLGHFVDVSREGGASWSQIGQQLGVTKQGAQQRFVSRWRETRGKLFGKAMEAGGRPFERFTGRARKVVVLAQEEARLLKHHHIGTEHILLGLIAEEEGGAAQALKAGGLSLASVRSKVEEMIGTGSGSPGGPVPFTPRAKKALELSLREALRLGHNHIGTEHMLLGLLREGEGVAVEALMKLGADPDRVQEQVVKLLTDRGPGGSRPSGAR